MRKTLRIIGDRSSRDLRFVCAANTGVLLCGWGSTDRGHYVVACNRRRGADAISIVILYLGRVRRQPRRLGASGILRSGPLLRRKILRFRRGNVGAQPWRDRRRDRGGAALPERCARPDGAGGALERPIRPGRPKPG